MTDYEHLLDGSVWADIPDAERRAMDETFGPEEDEDDADAQLTSPFKRRRK